MRFRSTFALLYCAFGAALACGSSASPISQATPPSGPHLGDDGGASAVDGATLFSSASSGDASFVGKDDCSAEAKRVYVSSKDGEIFAFEPLNRTFRWVPLDCQRGNSFVPTIVAMSIDRTNRAWLNLNTGEIKRADLTTGKCDPNFVFDVKPHGSSLTTLAFVTRSPSAAEEDLFLYFLTGDFYRFDARNNQIQRVGPRPAPAWCDLSGTGDGRLFGFCNDSTIRELDPATAGVKSTTPIPVVGFSSYAIAFWGGEFWFFTAFGSEPSKVTRYDPKTKLSSLWMSDVGFQVTGAGVSTCAPLAIPK